MKATVYKPSNKTREASLGIATIGMFNLLEAEEVSAQDILENSSITLYCLDFENRQAVFVEIPSEIDLSVVPFYFLTQFEAATRILTISFETMIDLAKKIVLEDSRFIFIHSVGRSGSTLASQIFSQLPSVLNISEPDALTNLVVARHKGLFDEKELFSLLRASVAMLCKNTSAKICVIKGRSFTIDLGDWLHTLFPEAKHLFLYRDGESYLQSGLKAFGQEAKRLEEEELEKQLQRRKYLGELVPAIAKLDANRFLPHAGILSLMWLSTMQSYVELCDLGIDSFAIRYESWQTMPQTTAKAMLDFCQCTPGDMTAVQQTLNRDSQQGTTLARKAVQQTGRIANGKDFEELHWHLKNHAFISAIDFVVPNTYKAS